MRIVGSGCARSIACSAGLAEKKRTVFVLHELEGVPPAEIASIVGAPVLTVRTRLFYARRELEALLAEEPSLASLRSTFSKASSEATHDRCTKTLEATLRMRSGPVFSIASSKRRGR
jgi:hypothetical protein